MKYYFKNLLHLTIGLMILLSQLSWIHPSIKAETGSTLQKAVLQENGHAYAKIDQSMTWTRAKHFCQEKGGYLASITSEAESDFVEQFISNGGKDQYWLGGSDIEEEGAWSWISGEPFSFQNWNVGEPNNLNQQEHYLAVYRNKNDKKWNDTSHQANELFSGSMGLLCEWGEITQDKRSETLDPTSVFLQNTYSFTFKRDYSQDIHIQTKNKLNKARPIQFDIKHTPDDIQVGFTNNGRSETVALHPFENYDSSMFVHLQNATKKNYTFTIIATDPQTNKQLDEAIINIQLEMEKVNFTISELTENPYTLSKTIRVTNHGEYISDFTIDLDDQLKGKVRLEPNIQEYVLHTGKSVEFVVHPVLHKDFSRLSGALIGKGANEEKQLSLDFVVPANKELFGFNLEDLYQAQREADPTEETSWRINEQTRNGNEERYVLKEGKSGAEFEVITSIEDGKPGTSKEPSYSYSEDSNGDLKVVTTIQLPKELLEKVRHGEMTYEEAQKLKPYDENADSKLITTTLVIRQKWMPVIVKHAKYSYSTLSDFSGFAKGLYAYSKGDIDKLDMSALTFIKGVQVIVGTTGLFASSPPLLIAAILLEAADKYFMYELGLSDQKPGKLAYLISRIIGYACMNVGRINTNIATSLVDQSRIGANGTYVARIHNKSGKPYTPEDITYSINGTKVKEYSHTNMQGAFWFTFPSNLIKMNGTNTITHTNTHRNPGPTILQQEQKVYLSIEKDITIFVVGKDREEAKKGLEEVVNGQIAFASPDFAVYPERIGVSAAPIEHKANVLNVPVFNIGQGAGLVEVDVFVDEVLLKNDIFFMKPMSEHILTIPWNPKAGKKKIRVEVKGSGEFAEELETNNTALKEMKIEPGKFIYNITNPWPVTSERDSSQELDIIAVDSNPILEIDHARLFIGDRMITDQYKRSSDGRVWFEIHEPLKKGQNITIELIDKTGESIKRTWNMGEPNKNTKPIKHFPLKEVYSYKIFTIAFDQNIDPKSITNGSIYVKKANGQQEDVNITLGEAPNLVTVNYPEFEYELGNYYTLFISDKVKGTNGKPIQTEATLDFFIIPESPVNFPTENPLNKNENNKFISLVNPQLNWGISKYDLVRIMGSPISVCCGENHDYYNYFKTPTLSIQGFSDKTSLVFGFDSNKLNSIRISYGTYSGKIKSFEITSQELIDHLSQKLGTPKKTITLEKDGAKIISAEWESKDGRFHIEFNNNYGGRMIGYDITISK